ncbi:MAG: hypothetical protein PSV35_03050 [bacterium]|nr:hypothetical protein [bacterium]
MLIRLSQLKGEKLLHKLLNYFKLKESKKFHITIPEVMPTEDQRGETCKLKALSEAIQHTALQYKSSQLPIYKGRNNKYSKSLRQLAKELGSVQGEVYSLEMLQAICSRSGYESEVYSPFNPDEYIRQLEMLIDANLAPMVFYDLCLDQDRFGLPTIGDGKNEHAGVILGYYKNECDETHFIVSQWNNCWDFDGMELALSAYHSLTDKREVESFSKVWRHDTKNTSWVLSTRLSSSFYQVLPVPSRTSQAMNDTDTPLKGQIMVVTKPRPRTAYLRQLGFYPYQEVESELKDEIAAINEEQQRFVKNMIC